ncbi:MAG: DNA-3-methyladenine glycosylase [Ktedonobacterales bacterium]
MEDVSSLLVPVSQAFYEQTTVDVARALIGKTLARRTARGLTAGIIVEVEAYAGAMDPASHAYRGLTPRNRTMFGPTGRAYVYLSYGVHCCINVVTEWEGEAAAVLVRALEPTYGIELMRERRGARIADRNLCRGPGRLCQAMDITREQDGADLTAGPATDGVDGLWVAETGDWAMDAPIATSPRIGISRAVDWPWRFYVAGNRYVSGRPV